jgi:RNA polymerase-binding protein DksA
MDKVLLEKVKIILLADKDRLEKDLFSIAEKKDDVANDFDSRYPNYGSDLDSNAAEVDTYSSRLSIEKSLEKILHSIVKALEKIDNGTYGVCEQCGKDISEARLKANPSAVYCLKCQGDNS